MPAARTLLSLALAIGLSAACDDGATGDAGPRSDGGARADGGARSDGGGDAGAPIDAGGPRDAGDPPSGTLAEDHPGDVGMGADPDVIWFEDFEEGSLSAMEARYDQVRNNGRFTLISETPNGSGSALAMRAGQGQDAVDLYKQLPDADEWYVRWYARYEAGVPWHHSGMWFGGYNPSMGYPSPMAGRRPNGDDRFSIAIEPVFGGPAGERFDTYDYWMGMHSWMADPIDDDGTAYYGNALIHRNDFTLDETSWVCLEVHVRINPDPASSAGAILEVWKNDALMQRFDDTSPMGYWIRDKFCPDGADGRECTDYPAPFDQTLDLRVRNTSALRLNAFWPQNYITDPAMGTLDFDQMVVARRRVGCIR
ncbi:MAG: hypothetical protein AB7S26_24455 [Sandaracinaceae bacterium]